MSRRRRSNFNPFISLTDILFNLVLVLLFASAIFAQDINQKYAENRDFQNRLSALQLERDTLMENVEGLSRSLSDAEQTSAALRDDNLSLEEQIAALVSDLGLAERREDRLKDRISVILGDLDDAELEKGLLEDKLTVVLGDLELAEDAQKLLEEDIVVALGNLEDAEALAGSLRRQVGELSRNNFLVVELEWLTESHDLDLHITDPAGNRFFWRQPTAPGVNSRLTLDNRIGARPNQPGLEIWTARELELGTYRVEVGLWGCDRTSEADSYKPCQTDALANLLVRHRDGDDAISAISLLANQSYAQVGGGRFTLEAGAFERLLLVAEVEVSEVDGKTNVEVRPAGGLSLERLAQAQ